MQKNVHHRGAVATIAMGLILAIGCGGGGNGNNGDDDYDFTVLCGTSFRTPMEELVKQYKEETGETVIMTFGGSEELLPHVKLKSQGDIFISHSPYMQYTKDADALTRYVRVGHMDPVFIVAKENPKELEINRIEDLAQEGLRVVLPDPRHSTCGEMVVALLEKKGIKDEVFENVGNRLFRSHQQVALQIELGHADVGVIWNGVAHTLLGKIEIVDAPPEYDKEMEVGIMGLSYSKRPEQVERFLKFVDEHGERIFTEFGYVKITATEKEEGDPS